MSEAAVVLVLKLFILVTFLGVVGWVLVEFRRPLLLAARIVLTLTVVLPALPFACLGFGLWVGVLRVADLLLGPVRRRRHRLRWRRKEAALRRAAEQARHDEVVRKILADGSASGLRWVRVPAFRPDPAVPTPSWKDGYARFRDGSAVEVTRHGYGFSLGCRCRACVAATLPPPPTGIGGVHCTERENEGTS